jgi:hypothetical protein
VRFAWPLDGVLADDGVDVEAEPLADDVDPVVWRRGDDGDVGALSEVGNEVVGARQ